MILADQGADVIKIEPPGGDIARRTSGDGEFTAMFVSSNRGKRSIALNARQKVPVLQDGILVLTESAAIVTYLSDAYGQPNNRLFPAETQERARCLEWCFFVISELDATSLYVMRRHGDLRHIYGEAPLANEAAAAYFQKQMRTVERALETNAPPPGTVRV